MRATQQPALPAAAAVITTARHAGLRCVNRRACSLACLPCVDGVTPHAGRAGSQSTRAAACAPRSHGGPPGAVLPWLPADAHFPERVSCAALAILAGIRGRGRHADEQQHHHPLRHPPLLHASKVRAAACAGLSSARAARGAAPGGALCAALVLPGRTPTSSNTQQLTATCFARCRRGATRLSARCGVARGRRALRAWAGGGGPCVGARQQRQRMRAPLVTHTSRGPAALGGALLFCRAAPSIRAVGMSALPRGAHHAAGRPSLGASRALPRAQQQRAPPAAAATAVLGKRMCRCAAPTRLSRALHPYAPTQTRSHGDPACAREGQVDRRLL
jgi:hypothetical protein